VGLEREGREAGGGVPYSAFLVDGGEGEDEDGEGVVFQEGEEEARRCGCYRRQVHGGAERFSDRDYF